MSELWEAFGAAAQTYVDVPWSDHGRTRFGLNCTGLLLVAAADIGITIDMPVFTHRTVAPGEIAAALKRHCAPIDLREARVGDIPLGVGLDIGAHHATHVGVLAELGGARTIVHAAQLVGRVVETRFDSQAWGFRSLWRPKAFL